MSHLFAWGQVNAELWRQYPELPPGVPIQVTGNPCNDLLRHEIKPYYCLSWHLFNVFFFCGHLGLDTFDNISLYSLTLKGSICCRAWPGEPFQ
jgi:hypothetical protein